MAQCGVSPAPYAESIVALLQQQLHDFELLAMNQTEEASYDGIALRKVEQRWLILLAGENPQSRLFRVSLIQELMLSVSEVASNIQDKRRRIVDIRCEVYLFWGRKDWGKTFH